MVGPTPSNGSKSPAGDGASKQTKNNRMGSDGNPAPDLASDGNGPSTSPHDRRPAPSADASGEGNGANVRSKVKETNTGARIVRKAKSIARGIPAPSSLVQGKMIIAGFVLLIFAMVAAIIDALVLFTWPLTTLGMALIAVGFGTTASMNYKGAKLLGIGAVAIAFSLAFPKYEVPRYFGGYLLGTERTSQTYMEGANKILTGRVFKNDPFQFIAREVDVPAENFVRVTLTNLSGVNSMESNAIFCFSGRAMRKGLSSLSFMEIAFRPESASDLSGQWIAASKYFDEVKSQPSTDCKIERGWLRRIFSNLAFGSALAQSGLEPMVQQKLTPADALRLVNGLTNDDIDARMYATRFISGLRNQEDFRLVSKAWTEDLRFDRVDLGLMLGWLGAIRGYDVRLRAGNLWNATYILASFEQWQIARLIVLAAQSDYTISANAQELLSWFLQATHWPQTTLRGEQIEMLKTVVTSALTTPEKLLDARIPAASSKLALAAAQAINASLAVEHCIFRNPEQRYELANALESSQQIPRGDGRRKANIITLQRCS